MRCIFRATFDDIWGYEERVTVWRARNVGEACGLAEEEGLEYAAGMSDDTIEIEYLGVAHTCRLYDPPGHGAEVFALMRQSDLDAADYVEQFFDTGAEIQKEDPLAR
ncbi:MAG: hypothetical protein ACRDYC_12105 [Acidimicrobiales bacterium]